MKTEEGRRTMKRISDFHVMVEGPMLSDYWQGQGLFGTAWDDLASGTGDTPAESLAQQGGRGVREPKSLNHEGREGHEGRA